MLVEFEKTGTVEGLAGTVRKICKSNEIKGLMILCGDDNGFSPDNLDKLLSSISLPLFGGVFPELLYGLSRVSRGSVVVGLTSEISVHRIEEVSSPATDFDLIIDTEIPEIGDAKTMFVFTDGYSKRVTSLIESLFNIFGLELNYIGGGAGSINPVKVDMKQVPCVLTNEGMKKDSAILALTTIESGIGVQHGWDKTLSGPHKVTESEGNIVKSLDWKPAFMVYKTALKDSAQVDIEADSFFEISKAYPIGISKLEAEPIVRDPFDVDENNGLVFNAAIPQESFVDILAGDTDSLIHAAGKAYQESINSFNGETQGAVFVVDCISRVLFLGDAFEREIGLMRESASKLIGVFSLGEIANSGRDYLELYNKTCVVGVLGG